MLQTWKDSFVNSGMLFANQATAKTLPYFYQQENQALCKQMETTVKQQEIQTSDVDHITTAAGQQKPNLHQRKPKGRQGTAPKQLN
jgi:hypothetical protein